MTTRPKPKVIRFTMNKTQKCSLSEAATNESLAFLLEEMTSTVN